MTWQLHVKHCWDSIILNSLKLITKYARLLFVLPFLSMWNHWIEHPHQETDYQFKHETTCKSNILPNFYFKCSCFDFLHHIPVNLQHSLCTYFGLFHVSMNLQPHQPSPATLYTENVIILDQISQKRIVSWVICLCLLIPLCVHKRRAAKQSS